MSEGDKVPNDVKGDLRSVLISSNGVKESRVEKDYHELSGKKLMWKNYGFKSLKAFLSALPDVCVIQYSAKDRENRVYGVQLEGTFMSSHAKKNSKVATTGILPVKQQIIPESGRLVEKDGSSFKITLSNEKASVSDEGMDDLKPNANGLFQVYVAKLPERCSENDLKECFEVYGEVANCSIVRSSIGRKIGFVRYALKEEALGAIADGRKNPPEIHGTRLEVGKPKSKSSSSNETGSEFSETSLSSTPSSPIKSTSVSSVGQESPTKSNTLAGQKLPPKQFANSQISGPLPGSFPHSTVAPVSQGPVPPNPPTHTVKTPLTVQVPTSQQSTTTANNRNAWTLNRDHSTKTLLSVHPASQVQPGHDKNINKAVSSQPKTAENTSLPRGQYGVIISGYDSKVSEASLKLAIQNVSNLDHLEYHPLYSIAWFRSHDDMTQAVNELNGKFIDGCVVLLKPLKENFPVSEENKRADVVREEKLPELQNDFSKIYDFYSEAISRCCERQYLSWLNNLPSIFEVQIMDLIDPCTYWVHLCDGTSAYQAFQNLARRLSHLNPSSDLRHLKKNEFGAGKYSYDDLWYRCYCREVSADGRNVHVMYIDYGNTEWLKRERTVLLNDSFFDLRPQGVLAKLSGLRYNSNNNSSADNSVLSSARKLLLYQYFQARKVSEVFSKSLILEIELLQSKGESVFNKLSSLPGVETQHRQSSPVPPLLLCSPPPIPTILKPLKDRLSKVNTEARNIWITDIRSPTNFYFQLVRSEALEAIRQIKEMLLKCNVQNKVMVKDPKISGVVCHHKNGLERSRVTVLEATNTPGKVTVLHVDTGRVSVVPLTSFIALPSEATKICFQARPAQLYGVPHETLAQSSQALEFLIRQATQVLRAIVVFENVDESVVVELFNSEGTNINKAMLEMAIVPKDAVSTRSQVLPQNQAAPSLATPVAFQNGVSPSSSGQASPNQIPVQVPSAATFPQMQASPDQVSSLNQVPLHPPFTQNPVRPEQKYARTQATSYLAQGQSRPSQPLGQNQISPTLPNQLPPKSQASVNQSLTQNQTSFNQGVGQNQAKHYQACAPSQISPQNQASRNQTPPQSQASSNQPTPQNRINHAPARSRASSNQAPHQRRASSNQTPPQGRASPNQAPQNQAFGQNQEPPLNRASGQISPNQNIHSSQIPPNHAFEQNRVTTNQVFPQKNSSSLSPSQISTTQKISPQISPYQNNTASRPSQNKTLGHEQTQPQKQPSPNQAFSGGSTNQTFVHKPPQSYQAPSQNRASSCQNATRHQAVPQNTTQGRETPLQRQAAQTGDVHGHSNSFTDTMEKTPQSSVGLPNSRFYNSPVPKAAQKSQENNVSNTSLNTTMMTSQCPALQANNPAGFSKRVSTPQVITSQHPTSKNRVLPHSTMSQGHTPQGPAPSVITSQDPASSVLTLQGPTSSTSASRNEMGDPSLLAQFSKTRSNSSASSTSKNSFHSDENWDELDTNTEQDTNPKLNELQSPDNAINKDSGQSNKPRSSAQSKKEQTQTKNNPKNFAFGQTGAGKMNSTPGEINPHSLPGKGGKAYAKNLHSIKMKVLDQEKVLSISGPEQKQAVQRHKTLEQLELVSEVKMLENENLMLKGEIKRNRKIKAELEKQLGL